MEKQKVACNLCGSQKYRYLFSAKDWIFKSDEDFSLVKCTVCGLVFLNPRPKNLDEIYPLEYYKEYGTKKTNFIFLSNSKIKKILRFKKTGKILDVGCGKGFFLNEMRNYNWEVWGIDISDWAIEYARKNFGLKNLYCTDILSIELPKDFFDIITLWQVIEHLEKPLEVLEKLKQSLKKDGILIIECPNFSSFAARLFKDKWQGLDLPRHFFQFNPNTLKKMLDKAGFKIKKIDYLGNTIFNLVILRTSILRALKIEKETKIKEAEIPLEIPEKRNFAWIFLRSAFTFFCFIVSEIFAFFKMSEVICVYATKK